VIEIFIPGDPVAKGRPIMGRGFGGRPTVRTPQKTVIYENLIKHCAQQSMLGKDLLEGPLTVGIIVSLPMLKSFTKKQREDVLNKKLYPTKKPDVDNFAKSALDGLNGIVFHDDAQVVGLTITKHYAEAGGMYIEVRRV
jgi:Holliday junction resolvase RusA-like endonuclease